MKLTNKKSRTPVSVSLALHPGKPRSQRLVEYTKSAHVLVRRRESLQKKKKEDTSSWCPCCAATRTTKKPGGGNAQGFSEATQVHKCSLPLYVTQHTTTTMTTTSRRTTTLSGTSQPKGCIATSNEPRQRVTTVTGNGKLGKNLFHLLHEAGEVLYTHGSMKERPG